MAKSTSTRNTNMWETATCKRPEQEAQRLRPRGSGPLLSGGYQEPLFNILRAARPRTRRAVWLAGAAPCSRRPSPRAAWSLWAVARCSPSPRPCRLATTRHAARPLPRGRARRMARAPTRHRLPGRQGGGSRSARATCCCPSSEASAARSYISSAVPSSAVRRSRRTAPSSRPSQTTGSVLSPTPRGVRLPWPSSLHPSPHRHSHHRPHPLLQG